MLGSPPPYTLARDDIVRALDSDTDTGLTSAEADRRLAYYGPNTLLTEAPPTVVAVFLDQLRAPLVVVLLAATVVSAIVWLFERGQPGAEALPYDSIVIFAIVLLNALLGVVQEYRAEQSVRALKALTAPEAHVLRDGERRQVPADQLVPGDILLLQTGDRVAADARLLDHTNLQVDESALTGESVPVGKHLPALDPDTPLADRDNMVFAGTAVTYGHGRAVVAATGMQTEMGGIATLIQTAESVETPLQRELAVVGRQLGILVLVISAIVFITGVVTRGALSTQGILNMFLFGVALAVAAIPEGLPAIVTAALALGVRRMAERNAIVRKLPAVETLGSATVICSDKTGTLTRNEMMVRELLVGVDHPYTVTGEGYIPRGEIQPQATPAHPADFTWTLIVAALCNDAHLVENAGRWQTEGDPTEAALLVAAVKSGCSEAQVRAIPRVGEIPFSSERKRMTTLHPIPAALSLLDGAADGATDDFRGEVVAATKGAPDVVLDACRWVRDGGRIRALTSADRERIRAYNLALGERALRTLALAYHVLDHAPANLDGETELPADSIETDLVFLGLVGLIDPPRPEVPAAVAQARRAGIRAMLITGDHGATALAVAREIGLAGPDDRVLTGADLNTLDQAGLDQAVRDVSVFARVDPVHKLRIVEALQRQGHIVAMTGDGVNDAPALKRADIGVAMGLRGTDVAKEAADMVLTDDNFATIVSAISEGRAIFENIRKFIRYLLSSNAGEVLTMFFGIMLAVPLGFLLPDGSAFLPLLAVQILWINLVTDGAPALALGIDPQTADVMGRPPRRPDEPVITRGMWTFIGAVGVVMMLGTLGILEAYYPGGLFTLFSSGSRDNHTADVARTVAFTTLMLFQMFNALNARHGRLSIFRIGLFRNRWLWAALSLSLALHALVVYTPALQAAFDTVPLTSVDWLRAALVASSALLTIETLKLLRRLDH